MNKAWVQWVQGIAVSDTLILLALYVPEILNKFGVEVFEEARDGSDLFLLAIFIYIVSCCIFISFINPPFRKALIPQEKNIINFYIPYSIILGYIVWGSVMLFSLSQPGAI